MNGSSIPSLLTDLTGLGQRLYPVGCAFFLLTTSLSAQEQHEFATNYSGSWPPKDNPKFTADLRERILAHSNPVSMEPYSLQLKTDYWEKLEEKHQPKQEPKLTYEMVPIQGGTFRMGASEGDEEALPDERPGHYVKVDPFWMGKFEITWDLFEPFMISGVRRDNKGQRLQFSLDNTTMPDVVSAPTSPYTEMSFGMGRGGFPAVCMTHHAAQKFCQWLSAKTGHFYRLPTEAEWEYACRAGTVGPFSCPTDELEDYAVIDPKFVRTGYEKIGTKKPNPWGLYDMHGNVMEWCADQYDAVAYRLRPEGSVRHPLNNPFVAPNRLYPRVARGGSWYDPAKDCRSSSRFFSEPGWQAQDPQLPKSAWYLTDAQWLGFRIVRPLQIPDAAEMDFYWNSAAPDRIADDENPDFNEFGPNGRELEE